MINSIGLKVGETYILNPRTNKIQKLSDYVDEGESEALSKYLNLSLNNCALTPHMQKMIKSRLRGGRHSEAASVQRFFNLVYEDFFWLKTYIRYGWQFKSNGFYSSQRTADKATAQLEEELFTPHIIERLKIVFDIIKRERSGEQISAEELNSIPGNIIAKAQPQQLDLFNSPACSLVEEFKDTNAINEIKTATVQTTKAQAASHKTSLKKIIKAFANHQRNKRRFKLCRKGKPCRSFKIRAVATS